MTTTMILSGRPWRLPAPGLVLLVLLLAACLQYSCSFQCSDATTRRSFFAKAAAAAAATAVTLGEIPFAHAAVDVSGLRVEPQPESFSPSNNNNGGARGVPPSQLKSGPLANTPLGFQVGGGPRPEEVVRAIDAPRYDAVRRAQGLGPKFLEGVPTEPGDSQAIRSELGGAR